MSAQMCRAGHREFNPDCGYCDSCDVVSTTDRTEIADWLAATGFPWDWDVEARPPVWLLDELAAAWVRRDGDGRTTVEDYRLCLRVESMAFREADA